jgi:hypothetical protein
MVEMKQLRIKIAVLMCAVISVQNAFTQTENLSKPDHRKIACITSDSFYDPKDGIAELIAATSDVELRLKPSLDELSKIHAKLISLVTEISNCTKSIWCGEGNNYLDTKAKEGQSLSDQYILRKSTLKQEARKLREERVIPVERRIQGLLKQFASEKGFDLVIDRSKRETAGVTYSIITGSNPDITKALIQFCNNRKELTGPK